MLIADLHVILKVAEFKSIKLAAESLDLSVATASAAVKRVEKAYGIELFVRSTRNLRLSATGEKYIPQIENALIILDDVHQNARGRQDLIEGDLRLAAPSDLGRNIVLPWLDEFMQTHSRLTVKMHISDSNIDFYRDPVDMAIRYGKPKDSSMYGFKICNVPRVLCASPDYLRDNPAPVHPQDLFDHNGLLYQLHDVTHDVWRFAREDEKFKIKISSNRITNDAELVRRWCIAGQGLAYKSILDMSSDLLEGKVIPLMSDWIPKATELWFICPSRQLITPTVRLLREFVKAKCDQVFEHLADANL